MLTKIRTIVERPDYRYNGKYQFVKGYTGGGAQMCVHMTREEIEAVLTEKAGPGILEDDGVDLWWVTEGDDSNPAEAIWVGAEI